MTKRELRHFLAWLAPERYRLMLGTVASAIRAAFLLPIPLLLRDVIDGAGARQIDRAFLLSVLAIVGLYLLNSGAFVIGRMLVVRATKRAAGRIRRNLIEKLYVLSHSALAATERSRLHAIVVHDSERIDRMSNAVLCLVAPAAVIGIGLAGVLVYLNASFALTLLALGPVVWLLGRLWRSRLRAAIGAFHDAFDRFSSGSLFTLDTMSLTRLQAAEPIEASRRVAEIDDVYHSSTAMVRRVVLVSEAHNVIITIGTVVILLVGGLAVARNQMTVGELLSFYMVAMLLRTQLHIVTRNGPQVAEGLEAAGRVIELLEDPATEPYRGTRPCESLERLVVDDVWFGYEGRTVLRGVTLRLVKGEVVALVGPNGSGKTTISSLILGLHRPDAGRVLADGIAYDELDIRSVRARIGVVPQTPVIFAGTVADNIAYGRPEATRAEIEGAATTAAAAEFVAALEDGYDTWVGEDGVRLSGGQRQRIAIARALLGSPDMLILDEPGSNLEEHMLRGLLERIMGRASLPAILLITHDQEVASMAGAIHRIEAGRLVAMPGADQVTSATRRMARS